MTPSSRKGDSWSSVKPGPKQGDILEETDEDEITDEEIEENESVKNGNQEKDSQESLDEEIKPEKVILRSKFRFSQHLTKVVLGM